MTTTPGLQRRRRKRGADALYWVASAISTKAGDYPTPTIRIHEDDPTEIAALCQRYTSELMEWLTNDGKSEALRCDGTVRGLSTFYRKHPESPYVALKFNTRAMYDESLNLIEKSVGDRQLARLTGTDFRRWYNEMKKPRPLKPGEAAGTHLPERVRRAFKVMQMVRIIVSFGVTEDVPHCTRLATILGEMRFAKPGAREVFITFEQSKAIIRKAIQMGRPSIAVAQALQFDLTLRQVDVIGQWEKGAQGTFGIVDRGQRGGGGLVWSDIDGEGVLRKRTTKTGQDALHDTTLYPLVRECLELISPSRRIGPIVVNEETGLPYLWGGETFWTVPNEL